MAVGQQRLHQSFADAVPLMRRRYAHFVDEQLGRFVGMHVVNARRKPHDRSADPRHDEVVARVGEELGRVARVHIVVKHVRRYVDQHVSIGRAEQADGDGGGGHRIDTDKETECEGHDIPNTPSIVVQTTFVAVSYVCGVKLEDAIQQRTFQSPQQKAVLNILHTAAWLTERSERLLKQFDITPQQFNVLRILRGRHPQLLCAGEVKSVMIDRNPDLTRLCDRLLAKGFIDRQLNGVLTPT